VGGEIASSKRKFSKLLRSTLSETLQNWYLHLSDYFRAETCPIRQCRNEKKPLIKCWALFTIIHEGSDVGGTKGRFCVV